MKGAGSCLITIIFQMLLLCIALFNNIYPNPSVSVLVRQSTGQDFSLVTVSPKGDQLFYLSSRSVILNLVTGQKRQVKKSCYGTSWLDNDTLLCNNSEAPYLLDTTDLSRTSIESVDAEKQNYTNLISEIDRVYRIDSYFSDYNYLIKSTDEKFYYLSNVKKSFGPNISVTLIPYRDQGLDKVSPDGKYYFRYNNENWLRIYDKTNDQLVREISLPGRSQAAGWMYDSSGVIYMTERNYFDFRSHHIYKLNVSLKEGLTKLARNSLMGLIGLILLFGILYLLRRWRRLWHRPQNRLLLVLVPQPPNDEFSVVSLSPEGDKLAYILESGRAFILDLVTDKTHWLPKKCEQQTWPSNQTLLCHNRPEGFKVDVRDFLNISISQVDAKKEELPHLDTHPPLFSPNGKYYCTYSSPFGLQILTTQNDQLVRKLTFEKTKTHLVGWMYDSSGVIFLNNNPVLGDTSCPIYNSTYAVYLPRRYF